MDGLHKLPGTITDQEKKEAREFVDKALNGASDGEKQRIFMYLISKGFIDCDLCVDTRKINRLHINDFYRTLSVFKRDRASGFPREMFISMGTEKPVVLKITDNLRNLYKL
jgi:hypothetical protein